MILFILCCLLRGEQVRDRYSFFPPGFPLRFSCIISIFFFFYLVKDHHLRAKEGNESQKGFAFRSLNSPMSFVVTFWSWGTANNLWFRR
ncbi:hypothetical protein M440DRAFT_1110707 [Trichoderma longibrachiatum ATCC 18648]|uniref:Uncharacterized protein n=1 Tax=Trichoderma longibrachiatum ATCC 18648 TaxID=983965 RepID=A0A2T4CEV6_TRILO|nr:hypothetical protein M440DRAFT_1110707 [Trichoderma longibrachiatum ATCC 18648]